MKRVLRALTVLGVIAALGVLAVGIATASPQAKQSQSATHAYKSPHFVLQAQLVIKSDDEHGKKGSDGKWHDSYLPANFTAIAGVPTKVTVYNYDDMPHSFTSSGLHLNAVIPAAKGNKPGVTTFTFTAKKAGKYLWWCAKPCDPWAMAHIGFMRGYVTVAA